MLLNLAAAVECPWIDGKPRRCVGNEWLEPNDLPMNFISNQGNTHYFELIFKKFFIKFFLKVSARGFSKVLQGNF